MRQVRCKCRQFLRQLRRQGHKATNGRGRPPPVAPRSLALTSPSTARPLDSAVALLCGAAAAIVIVPCIGSSFCEVPSTPSVQPPTRLASTGEQAHPSISTQHRRTHLPPKRGKQFSWVAPSTPTRSTSRSLSSARGDALAQRQGTTRHTSSTENSSRLGSLSIEKERDKAATRCAADPGRQSRADRARDINALMTMFLRLPFVPRLVGHGSPVDLAIGILGLKHVDLCRLRIQEQETPAGRPCPRYAELRLLRLCIERLEARGADEWCCWPRHGRADVRLTAAPRRVQLALVLHAVREVRGTESFALGALTLGHTAELDFVTCDASFVCKRQHHPQHRTVGVVAANAAMTGGHGGRWWMAKRKGLSKLLCQRDGTTRSGKWRGGCARRWFVCHQHSRLTCRTSCRLTGSWRPRAAHGAATHTTTHRHVARFMAIFAGLCRSPEAPSRRARHASVHHGAAPHGTWPGPLAARG